jgi:predicted acylesterase/phospholipase RssA
MSTSFGFFSTISAGSVFGRFVGDGSLLTNLPVTAGLTTVSNNLTTVSNTGTTNTTNITTVSNAGTTNTTNITTVSNTVNYLLAVSNISAVTMSTSFGFFSTISAGNVFGRFVGDGSLLTNLPVTAAFTTVSNTVNYLLAVSNISAVTMSTSFGFFSTISAGTVFGRFVGDGSLLTNLPVTTALATVSNNLTTVSNSGVTNTTNIATVSNTVNYLLAVSNISAVTMSTSFGFFSTISAGNVFGRFVGDGSLLINLPVTAAFTTVSNTGVTNTTNITTVSNTVNYLLAVSNISAVTMSTSFGFFSTISAGTVFGRFVGDGSLLTGIVGGSGGMSFVPPVLSTTLLSTVDLTARNISVGVISTSFGFFSTISAGTVFGRFSGDGSLLTGIVGASGGISFIPPVLSTTLLSTANLTASTINTDILNTRLFSTASGSASTFTIGTLFAGTISSASIGVVLTAAGAFSSISAGTANIDILNTRIFSTAAGTASSFTIGSIFGSSGSISSIIGNEAKISTVTANTLSSYIVYASSVNTPNIYVTNIYANDGGIANVVASSLNASRAVFVQVIASSFQGSLIGKNLLTVETY